MASDGARRAAEKIVESLVALGAIQRTALDDPECIRLLANGIDAETRPKWTRERPTEPGFYWIRQPFWVGETKYWMTPYVVKVDHELRVLWDYEPEADELDALEDVSYYKHSEWCGPLQPPEEE